MQTHSIFLEMKMFVKALWSCYFCLKIPQNICHFLQSKLRRNHQGAIIGCTEHKKVEWVICPYGGYFAGVGSRGTTLKVPEGGQQPNIIQVQNYHLCYYLHLLPALSLFAIVLCRHVFSSRTESDAMVSPLLYILNSYTFH